MNRRHFFQTLLSAPLLTPLLLASQSRESDREIHLISDTPHVYLPILLKELFRGRNGLPGSFAFSENSLHKNALHHALSRSGWQFITPVSDADLKLSFRTLYQPARPSFTLVKGGKIWDVRAWNLRSLWEEMAKNQKPCLSLTVAALTRPRSERYRGEIATVYMNGHKKEAISLGENLQKSYATPSGRITVQITNRSARVLHSSCRHKICLYSPSVSLSGERIICAPNFFLLEVQGNTVDTVIG
jgi:hypothetical protein